MIPFVILAVMVVAILGFTAFVYHDSQRRFEALQEKSQEALKALQEQLKAQNEMLMAGSLEEWKRIKEGKEPAPNEIKDEPNFQDMAEDKRIPFDEITAVRVDEGPKAEIKLYR